MRNLVVLLALLGGAVLIIIIAPVVGWPPVLRLPAVLFPVAVAALIAYRRELASGLEAWRPSTRFLWIAAGAWALLLGWVVLSRFWSGEINAVDFTVYFDRPGFQTMQGRPLFVESADRPEFADRTILAVHAYWAMLPISLLYGIVPTPFWLHALSVVAVVAGAVHIVRISLRTGFGGVLACATALAFLLNANTARTLNYGFHPEILYAWFVPWMLDAGLAGRRGSFAAATIACILVKEDACLPMFAASVAIALSPSAPRGKWDRVLFLVAPTALGLVNVAVYYRWVVPALQPAGVPSYASFWANYGATPVLALVGMLTDPVSVFTRTLGSGFFTRVLVPHLFLPLIGWRWLVGAAPIVALYGASANPQLRDFGIYYSIVLVPFLVLGASAGGLAVVRRLVKDDSRCRSTVAVGVLLGALLIGSTTAGYSLRPWRAEIGHLKAVLTQFAQEPVVLVQSGLYPHAGYDERIQLLTPDALRNPKNAGAVLILAPGVGAYPFSRQEIEALARSPEVRPQPSGLVSVRIGGSSREGNGQVRKP